MRPILALALLAVFLPAAASADWLLAEVDGPATVTRSPNGREIALENGLVRRTFRTAPGFATVGLLNLASGEEFLRAVEPEAVLIVGGERVAVGGLAEQPDRGYLDPAWLEAMPAPAGTFRCTGYEVGATEAPFPWTPARHAPPAPWPPAGIALTAFFAPPPEVPAAIAGLRVAVRYELYEGLPVLAKEIRVENRGAEAVTLDGLVCEALAVTEQARPRLHVESDYAFGDFADGWRQTVEWGPDLAYTSQIDYRYQLPVRMTSRYPLGPGIVLAPSESFRSFRTFELLHDSDDRERQGLARRRLYRTLAPQALENPVLMHVRSSDSESVRLAIDQCAEAGFEMVIMTFWSGFDLESRDPAYIERVRSDVEYAHSRGIELGGYTLMCASRDVGAADDVIDPATGQPGSKFGQSACLASAWSDAYFERVLEFIDATGLDVIETDGPYHGDVCASTSHPHHAGLADSQVAQWSRCAGFYHACRERGIYVNTPDWYYLQGSNKCAMGYRESNWSLPRDRQIVLARQNIFDGTYRVTPSMGWMFVPLVEYHGGGPAATLEPLSEHLPEYEWHLAQNFGSGVQACWRGPRLYDALETRAVVKKWVDFYKRHRAILDSDVIHVRRPDGRRLDAILHANPHLPQRGMAMVYNSTDRPQEELLALPLYYTGLTRNALVRERDGAPVEHALDREFRVRLPVSLAPRSFTWFAIEGGQ
ncbi:MAG: alpha-galactosidase [Planctomycetota bacterium]